MLRRFSKSNASATSRTSNSDRWNTDADDDERISTDFVPLTDDDEATAIGDIPVMQRQVSSMPMLERDDSSIPYFNRQASSSVVAHEMTEPGQMYRHSEPAFSSTTSIPQWSNSTRPRVVTTGPDLLALSAAFGERSTAPTKASEAMLSLHEASANATSRPGDLVIPYKPLRKRVA
ncbi:hypothetical protein SDRG_00951 [Saprolegnia diclina VS20]|uniref:Uncharacterized protein n=1 Tax=Saprolegnia diclina (strain VS20) TaxID=1156394 RepID=T0R6M4_SAPDV|nr:hypothetical protein SDRG_00951 [Saprolegnia diclina VS20]EQC42110.1 hypothetical protein SDRG_00951 [Saprolegnia diclina VS20]|eukprot:XP_008604679.1 hypothetical protein SDRG_00951 [Saprolegnia diclina VS20]